MSNAAGQSARDEYERRRVRREEKLRARFGRLAGVAGAIGGEPASERVWRVGAEGEERIGKRFAKLLEGRGVTVLHDLRLPGRRANIDHLTVGPGGVTVVDAKNYRGKVKVRGGKLWVDRRNRTKLVDGLLGQVELVKAALTEAGFAHVPVRGALAWVNTAGLPLLPQKLKRIKIDGPKPIARFARRKGALSDSARAEVTAAIQRAFAG